MDHAVLQTPSDRYVIEQFIAEGGMGAIYRGKKLGMSGFEKEVVFKQLLPEYTSDPKFIDLFLREARITASLDHANIVHTIDLVAAEHDYFIVMEYVRGADLRTLQRRARRRGHQLSGAAALRVGRTILDALAYAHALRRPDGQPLNLIHRDISPSNILLSGDGDVKLTDFGIAKASTQRSVFYKVKGKIGYMSPEQARGEPLDQRSDLFSLGVCIYEALVGQRLFVADMVTTPAVLYAQPVPPPSQARPELPAALDEVMGRALALDRTARFQTADEFAEALDQVAYRHGLVYSSSEMAAHLREVCGEVSGWNDAEGEAPEGPRSGTAPLDDSGRSAKSGRTHSGVSLGEVSRMMSMLAEENSGEVAAEAVKEPDAAADSDGDGEVEEEPVPGGAAIRSAWEMVETLAYPDGRPPGIDLRDLERSDELPVTPVTPLEGDEPSLPQAPVEDEAGPTLRVEDGAAVADVELVEVDSDGDEVAVAQQAAAPAAWETAADDGALDTTRPVIRARLRRRDETPTQDYQRSQAQAGGYLGSTALTNLPNLAGRALTPTALSRVPARSSRAPHPSRAPSPSPSPRTGSSRTRYLLVTVIALLVVTVGVVLGVVLTGPDQEVDEPASGASKR